MKDIMNWGKRNGVAVMIPSGHYGVSLEPPTPYQYPKGHRCCGCPYTLHTTVPSCMFPARSDGSCLWYDLTRKKPAPPPKSARREAAERIFDFIQVLESVKKRKGF